MKELIKHLLKTNLDEIVSKSFLNCHVKGLHSIMLLDSPGKTIRLFITTPNHELWRNKYDNLENLSLAFHAHHCDITLNGVYGNFTNLKLSNAQIYKDDQEFALKEYVYKSKIKDSSNTLFPFKSEGYKKLFKQPTFIKTISKGESLFLKANEIHTVHVSAEAISAWFVFEGAEDPNYKNVCYTNTNVNTMSFDNLYHKPNILDICNLLHSVNLF